ncbi:unnamed protein product [Dicrocoelium dendriticum]|nr:unnamed protein product [Dicrocoelium dendriticum]
MRLRTPLVHLKCSPNLVVLCFFVYKTTESLLQAANRIHVYHTVCNGIANVNTSESVCRSTETNSPSLSEGIFFNHTDELRAGFPRNLTWSMENSKFLDQEISIQRHSGMYLVIYRCLLNIPATVACLFFGSWSKRLGHKWVMLIPCVGAILACGWFSCGLIPWLKPIPDVLCFIMVGALTNGLCGKSSAMSMGANSYITDISSTKQRTKLLGRLMGMNCFGLCIGHGLLALFFRYKGIAEVFVFAVSSNTFILLILLFLVQDSKEVCAQAILNGPRTKPNELDKDHGESTAASLNPKDSVCWCIAICQTVKNSYIFLIEKRSGQLRTIILFLLGSVLFNQMAKSGEQDAILLFVKNKPFRWTAEMYGYYIAVYYGCMAILLTLVLPLIEYRLAPHDTTLIMLGISFKIARLLTTALSQSTAILFVAAVGGSAAGFISSGIRSLLSKLVHSDDVGASFALVSCMESVSNLFGGSLFTGLYNLTITIFPGTIFVIDAVLHACILGAFIWLRIKLSHFEEQVNIAEMK